MKVYLSTARRHDPSDYSLRRLEELKSRIEAVRIMRETEMICAATRHHSIAVVKEVNHNAAYALQESLAAFIASDLN